jgi:DNA-binding transcriptional LysR family regulator
MAGESGSSRPARSLAELVRDWPWILHPQPSPARISFDLALQDLALPSPADIIECSSVYSMQQLIQLTDAVMVLSESACVGGGSIAKVVDATPYGNVKLPWQRVAH